MSSTRRFTHVSPLQEYLLERRDEGLIGFVPTMGALHEGHLSLVDKALEECDTVVISIFVNPKQFNNAQDLEKYPRTIEKDIKLLGDREVVVFHPEFSDVYPDKAFEVKLDLGNIADVMEGKFRPGHFDGVVTVVSRLFDIVNPDKAYFGEKDYQQLAVIHRMVEVQERLVEVVPCPILREESGLAMSSRNMLLSNEDKTKASGIYRLLNEAIQRIDERSPKLLAEELRVEFTSEGFDLEYIDITHPLTLETLQNEWVDGARIFIACYIGGVRLIDNIAVK